MKAFVLNRDSLSERLTREAYPDRALPPATPWLARGRPGAPRLAMVRDAAGPARVTIAPGGGSAPAWWAVRARAGGRWTTDVLPAAQTSWTAPAGADRIAVSAVDRVGTEGPVAEVRP
jgi:hypothetical protein